MSCRSNNKTTTSSSIRDGWATVLQRPVAEAGFIRPSTKLDTKKRGVVKCDPLAKPFDVSFEINPNPSPSSRTQYEYKTVGGDVTIITTNNIQSQPNKNVINYVIAAADTHLQQEEKGKLMRADKIYKGTNNTIRGEDVTGEILKNMDMLIPMAIDGHGRMGPLMMRFLFGTSPRNKQIFKINR